MKRELENLLCVAVRVRHPNYLTVRKIAILDQLLAALRDGANVIDVTELELCN